MSTLSVDVQVDFSGFSLSAKCAIPPTGITGMFGPSGCGKSTLLRAIAGLTPCQGSIQLGDTVWQSEQHILPTHRRNIGYVAQTPKLFPHLSVKSNLMYGLKRRKAPIDQLAPLTELMGVDHLLSRNVEDLSGGETQRIAIARALITQPSLLLMDEPLSALDTDNKSEILPYLERLQDTLNIPVIYVTHDISELERLASSIIVMNSGKIVTQQPMSSALMDEKLPFAHRSDAVTLLEGKVTKVDSDDKSSWINIDGSDFYVPHLLNHQQSVRLRIHSSDISLSLIKPEQTSVQNCIPVIVDEVLSSEHGVVNLKLAMNETSNQMIVASITQRSMKELGIDKGTEAWALVKGASLL
jgi:molybdate transport system ATP-binding protein